MIYLIAIYLVSIAVLLLVLKRAPVREDLRESDQESELAESLNQRPAWTSDDRWHDVDDASGVPAPMVRFDPSDVGRTSDRNAG